MNTDSGAANLKKSVTPLVFTSLHQLVFAHALQAERKPAINFLFVEEAKSKLFVTRNDVVFSRFSETA
jgi:hypothetical protein